LQPREVLVFGVGTILIGAAWLALAVNALACLVAVATVVLYLGVYTPLKTRTTAATLIGGFPGALPPVIGWAAARGSLGAGAYVLFAILFLWQVPHFHSISWVYREDYARAGIRMLPVVDRDGNMTFGQIVFCAVALIPVSLLASV
jgi:protoheme IX farnesyltransferase